MSSLKSTVLKSLSKTFEGLTFESVESFNETEKIPESTIGSRIELNLSPRLEVGMFMRKGGLSEISESMFPDAGPADLAMLQDICNEITNTVAGIVFLEMREREDAVLMGLPSAISTGEIHPDAALYEGLTDLHSFWFFWRHLE